MKIEMLYGDWEIVARVRMDFAVTRAFNRSEKFWESDLKSLTEELASDWDFVYLFLEEIWTTERNSPLLGT